MAYASYTSSPSPLHNDPYLHYGPYMPPTLPSAELALTPTSEPQTPHFEEKATKSPGSAEHVLPQPSAASPRRELAGAAAYRNLSWMMGFKEKYSLLLFIIFGGALVGFCLARTLMMSPKNAREQVVPGEWFWYKRPLFKPNLFIHIYLSIISGIFAVFQFIPAIRRRQMFLHRLNGYMTILLLVPSTICGSILARHVFGGDLSVQGGYYVLGIMIVFSSGMGISNAKISTRKHRKWMLRTVTYASAPITVRLIALLGRPIISGIGTYYALWRCDELIHLLDNAPVVSTSYPLCAQVNVDPSTVYVAVHAKLGQGKLHFASIVRVVFGMSLWLGILIHALGIEIYLRETEAMNQHRRGFVLERGTGIVEEKRPEDDH